MRILQNEKYKGAALLQKSFTVDFLKKRMKINESDPLQLARVGFEKFRFGMLDFAKRME